jgi:1-acyl-sn-glycerol-3-phosphate acyltransferase
MEDAAVRPRKKNKEAVPDATHKSGKPLSDIQQPFLTKAITFIGLIIWILFSIPLIWLSIPLRLLHVPFKKLGIPPWALPTDLIQSFWASTSLKVMGVSVCVEGVENVPLNKTTVFMPNHISNMDPFVVMGYSPITAKFIFKRSLMLFFPFMFLLAYFLGHIPINRGNRQSAIKSLEKAAKKARKYDRSIVIFPEGTRSTTGALQEFKRGPFHLARAVGTSITPVVISGTYELWQPHTMLINSGVIKIKFLPQIPVSPGDDIDEISNKVRAAMTKEQQTNPYQPIDYPNPWPAIIFVSLLAAAVYFVWGLCLV